MLVALAALASATTADAKTDYVYGPAPDWTTYRQLGETALRAKLPTGQDWAIEWPNGYAALGWSHGVRGYLTCGLVRALKADQKGRYQNSWFAIVIDQGQVKSLEYELTSHRNFVNRMCPILPGLGKLPPVSLMPGVHPQASADDTSATSESGAIASLGIAIRSMPEGAYVASVVPGSPAAKAGFVPGTVITRVNGIDLASMGTAMTKLLGANAPLLTLDTAAGGHVAIRPK